MEAKKRKSDRRWGQFNLLVDHVVKRLPTPTHGLFLLCCFRHATPTGHFRESIRSIAAHVGIGERRAKDIMQDLVNLGVIEQDDTKGRKPPARRIAFTRINGALHCTIKTS